MAPADFVVLINLVRNIKELQKKDTDWDSFFAVPTVNTIQDQKVTGKL
jgi:hypothetical protein